jgi:hypothetical protein
MILLVATTTVSVAGPIYVLENAVCTGGNQIRVGPGDGDLELACNPVVDALLRMRFDYVPGSAFDYSRPQDGPAVPAARLSIDDGRFSFTEDFTDTWPLCEPCQLEGSMPIKFGRADLIVGWWYPWFLHTTADGQWMFGVEFGGDGTEDCAEQRCLPHYFSWGTYDGWRAVPVDQPGTFGLLALGLLGLFPSRRPTAG